MVTVCTHPSPMMARMKTVIFIHNHSHKVSLGGHWINMFIFRKTLRKRVSFQKISLLTSLSSLYDCWCFKAIQANRFNLSASLISWQKSGEKNYKQWAFRIGISHCAEFKSVPLSPTSPPWAWPFLANLSIPHTMVQREPLLLGPLLLCLEKMFA